MKTLFKSLTFATALLAAGLASAADLHKIVIHLDEADPARQNLVLNNASNLNKYYLDKGEEAQIEVVAYGPGLTAYVAGKSPVADRIASFQQNYENVSFKACGNTKRKMEKKAGKEIALLDGVEVVPSGAVHLVARQEEGWSYLRP
ncbi:MAG: DsrE family protein [Gammaproteobacteria bacterium]